MSRRLSCNTPPLGSIAGVCLIVMVTRALAGIPVPQVTYTSGDEDVAEELRNSRRVADWSASNAVNNANGNDFERQRNTTAQYVAKFTAPVTKEQAGRVFNTLAEHYRAGDVGSALASNSGAIWRAAGGAAASNYQLALQEQRGRGGGSGYHHNQRQSHDDEYPATNLY